MKTKLFTIAMTAALMLTAMTKVQAQNFDGPCLPPSHGLDGHQSAFCGVMQMIALASGTNWVSFNVEITLDDLKAALVAAVPGTEIVIKSKDLTATYKPTTGRWTGRLTALDLAQMYRVNVAEGCEVTLEGMPVDPADHPFIVVSGANWIGFPLRESLTLTNAFAGFAVQNDVIKSKDGTSQYKNGRWMGNQLTTLEPGKGYKYISTDSSDRTLVFPSSK